VSRSELEGTAKEMDIHGKLKAVSFSVSRLFVIIIIIIIIVIQ
jgi:hypothetical protein